MQPLWLSENGLKNEAVQTRRFLWRSGWFGSYVLYMLYGLLYIVLGVVGSSLTSPAKPAMMVTCLLYYALIVVVPLRFLITLQTLQNHVQNVKITVPSAISPKMVNGFGMLIKP